MYKMRVWRNEVCSVNVEMSRICSVYILSDRIGEHVYFLSTFLISYPETLCILISSFLMNVTLDILEISRSKLFP